MPEEQDMCDHNELLGNAWEEFCDRLKEAGKLAFRENAPDTPLDRAAGVQYISRYVSKALNQHLEFNDPLYPQFWHLQTPTNKSFGDNPDCTYLVGVVDGEHTYRIVGNRGTVTWVSFAIGGSAINNTQLRTEWDGSFVITLSRHEHPGNWIKLSPGLNRVGIRQFFGNWDTEEPMRISIERVGLEGPPAPPTPEKIVEGLRKAADWLIEDSAYWAKWIDYYSDRPNQFVPGVPEWQPSEVLALARLLHFCQWRIQPDEALVIDVRPPECTYWNFELGNCWMNSVDYRYRLSSLNSKQAAIERDGTVYVVVSHVDPGIPNWLDTGGHTLGLINQRWVESDASPKPGARLVKLSELSQVLPADVRCISAEERREQLRRRKIGVDRRFAV